jgi:hypothetical protein
MSKRREKYSFWIGRVSEDDSLELWLEFFEPRLALTWKREHFPGEKDVICVEHHESGKLSSSGRKTLSYWPEWANGDNWRRITSETVRRFDLILEASARKSEKMRETKAIKEASEKRRALELALAKEEAYAMPESAHSELTSNQKRSRS